MKEFIPEDTFEETDNKNELRNLLFNYLNYSVFDCRCGYLMRNRA